MWRSYCKILNHNRKDLPWVFLVDLSRFGTSGDYSPGCFQDRLFSSSVVSAPILLSENRRSKTQSTGQKESRQRKANSASEKPWLSYCLISPHETMNGSLIVWFIRYQGQNYGYLANFVLLLLCLFCYLQRQSSLIFRKSYIRGFWIHHSEIRPKYPLYEPLPSPTPPPA